MRSLKFLILLITLFASFVSFSQITIVGTVKDSQSQVRLSFCNIALKNSKRGTITNEDGVFSILVNLEKDTLLISYVGYAQRVISAGEVMRSGVVLLTKKEVLLEEVTVHATNDYLYELLDKCRKKMLEHPAEHVAKVYYGIQTQTREQPIELLECYYNGYMQGPVLDKMLLKNGRVALAELDHYCFLTLHSSKGIISMDPVRRDDRYPSMPMQLGKREMHKVFILEAVPGDAEMLHVKFTPVKNPERDCSGELWIDRKSNTLVRTDVTISNAAKHPFLPLFSVDTISHVDITLSRTYRQEEGATLPDHISFSYHVTYKSYRIQPDSLKGKVPANTSRDIYTSGIVCFYDYGEPFILPYFNYDPDYDDYRKISIIPYNELFWDNNNTLLLTEKQKENLGFLAREGSLYTYENKSYGRDFLMNLQVNGKKIFQNYYTFWSPVKRIALNREVSRSSPVPVVNKQNTVLSDLYNLKVQVLLDVNRINDTLSTRSYTVLDGKDSFFQLPEQPATRAFLNIWFDLCEMERMKMQAELDTKSHTLEQIDAIYKKTMEGIDLLGKQYLKEVKLGGEERMLLKWNRMVLQELGIDNLALFPLDK